MKGWAVRIILFGAPGAGKGTQATFLAHSLGVLHLASGDLFRRHQQEGTAWGLKAKERMAQGLLVPDEITIPMVLEELSSPSAENGFILDGFPRNLHQAQSLDYALRGRSLRIDKAIAIDVTRDELVSRLSQRWVCSSCQSAYHPEGNPPTTSGECDRCGGQLERRPDDSPEAVVRRLELYRQETDAVLEFYERAGRLARVHGVGSVAEVRRRINEALADRVPKGSVSS